MGTSLVNLQLTRFRVINLAKTVIGFTGRKLSDSNFLLVFRSPPNPLSILSIAPALPAPLSLRFFSFLLFSFLSFFARCNALSNQFGSATLAVVIYAYAGIARRVDARGWRNGRAKNGGKIERRCFRQIRCIYLFVTGVICTRRGATKGGRFGKIHLTGTQGVYCDCWGPFI